MGGSLICSLHVALFLLLSLPPLVHASEWAHPGDHAGTQTDQSLGRVTELEAQLLKSLHHQAQDPSLPSARGMATQSGAEAEACSSAGELLQEYMDLTTLNPMMLNVLDPNFQHQGISCGARGSEAGLRFLPLCPEFQECNSANQDVSGNSRRPAHIPPGAVAVCSSGVADTRHFFPPAVPLNCKPWYSMPRKELRKLLRSYVGANSARWQFPEEAEDEALMRVLEGHPELSCAPRVDYTDPGAVAHTVWRLRYVYVSGESVVFNASTVFKHLGYRDGKHTFLPFIFRQGSRRVRHVSTGVNLAYHQDHNFYHTVGETFPLFLVVHSLMQQGLPVLLRPLQLQHYSMYLAPLLGIPLSQLRHIEVGPSDLMHVDSLYQPTFQHSSRASRSLWRELRQKHLLHPRGVPMFNADWSRRSTHPLSDTQAAGYPSNWLVVVAQRDGIRRALAQHEELMRAVLRLFPSDRVVVFRGDMDILEARNLFRRTRVLVGVHGAALSNMVFMPVGASVLEIRPRKAMVSCLHWLAEACSLRYYLVIANGTLHTLTSVDMREVMPALKDMASSL